LGIGICAHDFMVAIAAYSIGTAIAVLAQLIWLASLVHRYDKSLVILQKTVCLCARQKLTAKK
ncbi:MAG: hypothetical protein IIX77_04815, partial [Oscillospiraceae bacterium]|nr:hypothetical protein [Oscillospiraceae bacterium]